MKWACICIYQRTRPGTWTLRLIHPQCPQHGTHGHWQAA